MSTYAYRDVADRSVIIQEAWFRAHTMGLGKVFDWVNPYPVPSVYVVKEGQLERWDQPEAYEWIRNQLLKEILARPIMIQDIAGRYSSRLRVLTEVCERGCPKDSKSLLEYLELFLELMIDFVVIYHLAEDERTPEDVRMIAIKARDEQALFAVQDRCIRDSLRCLYPQVEGFEQVIRYREIKYKTIPEPAELAARHKGWVVVPGGLYELGTVETFARAHTGFMFVR